MNKYNAANKITNESESNVEFEVSHLLLEGKCSTEICDSWYEFDITPICKSLLKSNDMYALYLSLKSKCGVMLDCINEIKFKSVKHPHKKTWPHLVWNFDVLTQGVCGDGFTSGGEECDIGNSTEGILNLLIINFTLIGDACCVHC